MMSFFISLLFPFISSFHVQTGSDCSMMDVVHVYQAACKDAPATTQQQHQQQNQIHHIPCISTTVESKTTQHRNLMHSGMPPPRGYSFNADDQPATAWLSTCRDADPGSGCNQDHIIHHELPDRQCSGLKIKCCRQRHPQ